MRPSRSLKNLLAFFALTLFPATILPADWPGWRGQGDGVSTENVAPEVPSAAEGVLWKADLPGRGVSSPVVIGGRAFVTAASGPREKRLHVVCLDVRDGSKLWERQIWATGGTQCHPKTSMAAPTPASDGEHIFALFASCDAAAFDREGTLLWCRALGLDYPNLSNQVGMASSPLLWRGLFLALLETDSEAFAIALDARTGENRWKLPREKGINWTSPIVWQLPGGAALVLQSSRGLTAVDPASGAKLWQLDANLDGIASGAGTGLNLYAPGRETIAVRAPGATSPEATVAWRSSRLRASTASLLSYEDRVYGLSSAGVLCCARAEDGEIVWQERLKGPFSASPVACAGKLYCVNEEGLTTMLDLRGEKRVLADYPIGETVLASPAIAEGSIYIRSEKRLWCLGASRAR